MSNSDVSTIQTGGVGAGWEAASEAARQDGYDAGYSDGWAAAMQDLTVLAEAQCLASEELA